MKKKILICIQNPFAIDNIFETIKKICKYAEISIITTNYFINQYQRAKYTKFKKDNNLKDFIFIPFYQNNSYRSMISIIKTHIFLKDLEKKFDFKDFDLCISDSKFFIWHRIILDKFLSSKCILIGLALDATVIPLNKFKDLIEGAKPWKIVKSLHKLREPNNKKKNPFFIKKIINIYNKIKDIVIDRQILSIIFHKQNFKYEKYDLNLLETKKFDYRLSFFFSSHFFWKKIYGDNKCFLVNLESSCKCVDNENKNKALFISTLWDNFGKEEEFLKKLEEIKIYFLKFKKRYPNILEIDFKFHPMESMNNIKLIKDEVKRLNLIKVNFIENTLSLQEIACNYSCVIGVMSSALLYLKNFCKTIDVYCLKLLSEKVAGKYFNLKLINENIKIYDELNDNFINNEIAFKDIKKTKRYKFRDIIFHLLMNKKITN
jgi:hypothetical protein